MPGWKRPYFRIRLPSGAWREERSGDIPNNLMLIDLTDYSAPEDYPRPEPPPKRPFDWRLLISWLLVGLFFGAAILVKLWKASF